MSTNELFQRYFEDAAKRLAQGKTSGISGQINPARSYSVLGQGAQPQTPDTGRESGWSLGQSFIDVLSSGSYFTAGVGRAAQQGTQAFGRGDVLGAVGALNPLGLIGGGVQGVADRRTWSQNLQDMGVSEADSAGWGLGLDIALDPFWLIPGGAIAAGIKGTTRGAVAASGATRAGVQFSKGAFDEASKRLKDLRPTLPNTKETAERLSPLRNVNTEPVADLFPRGTRASTFSGTGIKNLYEGIKQGNVENYAEWAALRRVNKANKAVRKDAKMDTTAYTEAFQEKFKLNPQDLLAGVIPAAAKAADEVIEGTTRAAEKPAFERELPDVASDASEAVEKATEVQTASRAVDDLEKDASAVAEATDNVIEEAGAATVKSVNARAREELGPARTQYMESRGLGKPSLDAGVLAKIKTSPLAADIAVAYDRMVSDPTNPAVVAAYKKLSEEVEDQFKYMTDELGINVKFVDEDPYQVKNADGEDVTDSRLFMEDILNNKQLLVYKTAEDQVHPILSKDINDKFRAVHDFFGHAASGRGVWADGEEAAWVSHSLMFSPLARRAMTTETRGQNSWVNKYGRNPETGKYEKFAEQKAGLLPDAYTLLPSEYAAIENQISATNSLIGRTTYLFQTLSDNVLDDMGLIVQPVRGYQYTEKTFANIKKVRDEITTAEVVAPGTPSHAAMIDGLKLLQERMSKGNRLDNISDDLLEIVKRVEKKDSNAALALRQVLNTPTDGTELLMAAAKAEGRSLDAPAAFKPITWTAKPGYSKPDFKVEDVQKYFPEDPILADPKMLDIAMGVAPATAVRAMKGETKQQALARRQAQIWEDFRGRNETLMQDAEAMQKQDWNSTFNNPNSGVFVRVNGSPVGLGKLPLKIPSDAITSFGGGQVMVVMSKLLENMGSMVIREPRRMVRGTGGLETTIASAIKRKVNVSRPELLKDGEKVVIDELFEEVPSDQVLIAISKTVRGAKFNVVDADGNVIEGISRMLNAGEALPKGAELRAVNDDAKEVIARLKRLKPEIKIDRVPEVIQNWIVKKFDDAVNATKSSNVRISKLTGNMNGDELEMLAKQLKAKVPEISTLAHAKLFVGHFDDAIKKLAKEPKRKFFIKSEELLPMRGDRKQKIDRDVESGAPIVGGKSYSRSESAPGLTVDSAIDTADYTMLTSKGSQFTGRAAGRDKANRLAQTQELESNQKLAALSNVARAVDTISGAIASKELTASPEQAQLLSRILGQLGKQMAPDASPQQVFKEFQKNAKMLYEDMVKNVESAAKREAVLIAAPRAFSKSIEENMAIIEAIEKTDPGELQRKVIQFTQDAIALVDESCRVNTAAARSAPGEFLNRILEG